MRIQSAMANLRKVSAFVSDSMKSKTTYYETTKRQFADLQQLCLDISEQISSILDSQTTVVSEDTSAHNDRLDRIESAIIQLCERMDRLEKSGIQPENSDSRTTETTDGEISVAEVVTPTESEDAVSSVTVKVKSDSSITKAFCRDVTQKYGSVLRKMATRSYPSVHIMNITTLLWDWYNARFINNRRYNCKFRYSILRYKKLIPSIVIAYAYHMECGDTDAFLKEFYDWISLLGSDSNITDHYATPFEVYDVEINKNSRYATETAEILYDMLYYLGLKDLSASAFNGNYQACINQGTVGDYMSVMDYDIYNSHSDFRDDLSILDRIGLAEMAEMEEFDCGDYS